MTAVPSPDSADAVPPEWRTEILYTREVPGRDLCCVQRFAFTTAVLVNVRFHGLGYGYDARYCYPLISDAVNACRDWDGVGDPPGEWIKEKVSGRARVPLAAELKDQP